MRHDGSRSPATGLFFSGPLCLALGLGAGAIPGVEAGGRPVAASRDAGPDAAQPWETVARRISAALAREPRLRDDAIEVAVSGLLVTLRGTVSSDANRQRALGLARRYAEPQMIVYDGLRVFRPQRR